MDILLKSATIFDPSSPYHLQKLDLLIQQGNISQIDQNLKCPDHCKEIQLDDLTVSPGWFDASVSFGEPGFEDRETLCHGLKVAAKSGFTKVAINSNGSPLTDHKTTVNYLKSQGFGTGVDVFPIGSLTKKSKGEDIAELYDMQQAGAIAFNDYKKATNNPNLTKIALQYAQSFGGLVMSYPNTQNITGNGIVNEGSHSTQLGLKGIPSISEELQISRDLFLLEYTGGKLHIPTISTQKSVDLIRAAKAKGFNITCSVSAHHLTLTDQELFSFDANYKMVPPLRTQEDTQALIQGVKDNTIDFITSDHCPIDIENKKIEFSNALDGAIGLESLFTSLMTVLDLPTVIQKLTTDVHKVFGLTAPTIDLHSKANLSLFTTESNGVFLEEHILSSSKNSPYLGKPTQGKVFGSYHQGLLNLA